MEATVTPYEIKGYAYDSLYSVDTKIQQCFAGPSETPIDCKKLKKDSDLAKFIK